MFEHDIGEAIFGIGSCRAGDDKLQAWVAQCKASVDSNLLWRVMALNQDAVRAELDSALEEARQHAAAQTVAATLTWVNYTNKSLKAFADAYKKVQGFYDANQKAIAEGGNKAFGVRLTGIKKDLGIDKFSITAGDRIFRFFRIDAMADFASEKIIQHMFSIRALVNPLDSIKLIEAQARNAKPEREALLGRLKVSRTFLTRNTPAGGMNAAQARELSEAWEGMKAKGGDTAAAAVKDPRLALVVGFVEGMNFAKLLVECKTKGDAKTYASLLASGMGIGAAMLDIAATVVKNTATASSASWSYQQLKLWGGTLSAGATTIGAILDAADAIKYNEKGYWLLADLYAAKSGVGGLAGLVAGGVTYSYAAPLISRLGGKVALSTATRLGAAGAAEAVIGLRIIGMATGWWATVTLFGIQLVIWKIAPNAIEEWVDHTPFGKQRAREYGGYQTSEDQDKALKAALIEMGWA
ncbi:T6SS effector BTH_I2691 family protein [Xenophilus aerolatus]